MNNFAQELYSHIKTAVDNQCIAAVFDCGDRVDIGDLVTDENIVSVTIRTETGAQGRKLCEDLAQTVNSLVQDPEAPELDQELRSELERLVELYETRTYH